jgi:hypothetical protein
MKIYEILEIDGGQILTAKSSGLTTYIPLDPANSDYAEYLRYTEWVEAGNKPEDFWAQTPEL